VWSYQPNLQEWHHSRTLRGAICAQIGIPGGQLHPSDAIFDAV